MDILDAVDEALRDAGLDQGRNALAVLLSRATDVVHADEDQTLTDWEIKQLKAAIRAFDREVEE